MHYISRRFILFIAFGALSFAVGGESKTVAQNSPQVLWRQPADIASRNLFFGPGGKKDEPRAPLTFEREDLNGSNPKFIVRDASGIRWTVKLGNEARPETVATRLIWAAGYFTNEDYFIANLRVRNMPGHLRRGNSLLTAGGARNARLKRHDPDEKKIGIWSWRSDPFRSSREWNGLRVLMALINNWDLKDENNEIYADKPSGERIYMVSDLGASFGAPGLVIPERRSKDDLAEYRGSQFLRRRTRRYVDFDDPARPSIFYIFGFVHFVRRMRLEWIGRRVPLEDARSMGDLLGRLSDAQIRDAFRAGGYSPREIDGYARIVEDRIAQLREL